MLFNEEDYVSKPVRITICLFVVAVLVLFTARSQGPGPTVSADTDSLTAALLKNPTDRTLHLQLVDAYLQNLEPELALLELSYAEELGFRTPGSLELKGRAQAILEQTRPALRTLAVAYMQDPKDETLLLIAILHHAAGDRRRGSEILQRIGSRMTALPARLLQEYERFYLNGRRTLAAGTASAIRDLDTTAFRSFFPLPELAVLSPSENTSTEASSTSVIIEVNHKRPIQRVRIGDVTVFDQSDQPVRSVEESFSRSFTHLQPIREGRNLIPIVAEDILGFSTRRLLTVNGLNFSPLSSWRGSRTDSLRSAFRRLQSYVPDQDLASQTLAECRALVIAGGRGGDSASLADCGAMMAELLSHRYSGVAERSAVKALVGDRCTRENIEMVTERWLQREATFRTRTTVFITGRWRISRDQWLLEESTGQWIDMKAVLEMLTQLATGGVTVLLDGLLDDRAVLESGLREIVARTVVPLEVLLLPPDGSWAPALVRFVGDPESPAAGTAGVAVSLRRLSSVLSGSSLLTNGKDGLTVARNPAAAVAELHRHLLQQTGQRLAAGGIGVAQRDKILQFCSDWRRVGEMQRYLRRELDANDLLVRAEEYVARTQRSANANP